MANDKLSEEQAQRLWKRAAQLQGEAVPSEALAVPEARAEHNEDVGAPGYSLEVVRQAAIDAGIDEQFVERALVEVRHEPSPGTLDRWADRFLKDQPKRLRVRRRLNMTVAEAYESLQRVFPNTPYSFNLVGTRGGNPLEGGRLIFEVANQVGIANTGNATIYDIRQTAGIPEVEVSLHPDADDLGHVEIEIAATLASGRRIATGAAHGMGTFAGGVLALIGSTIAASVIVPVGALGVAGVVVAGLTGASGGMVASRALFRRLYPWAIGRATKAFNRLIDAIEVDTSTGGAFAQRGSQKALTPGSALED